MLRPTTMLARDRFRGRPCQSNDDMALPDADEEDGELDRLLALWKAPVVVWQTAKDDELEDDVLACSNFKLSSEIVSSTTS